MAEENQELFDETLKVIAKKLEEYNSKTSLINYFRVNDVIKVKKMIKESIWESAGVKIGYELCEPYKDVGYVYVEGKEVNVVNADLFMSAINTSDAFDVYPKTNGVLRMEFTFNGLISVVKEEGFYE